jgi:type II secretion system protein H
VHPGPFFLSRHGQALTLVRLRRGFTAIEMVMVLVILGIIAAFGYPSMAAQLRRTRVNQASQVLAADLEIASALAARDRRPMVFEGRSGDYLIRDRNTGVVRFRRTLGAQSEYGVRNLHFEPPRVEFFPSGMTSSPMRVDLTTIGYTRKVQMTRAGYVRVSP